MAVGGTNGSLAALARATDHSDLEGARIVRWLSQRWQIVTRTGTPIGSPRSTRDQAEFTLDGLRRRARMTVRQCITCTEPFQSEGAHNRMCTTCRAAVFDPFAGRG